MSPTERVTRFTVGMFMRATRAVRVTLPGSSKIENVWMTANHTRSGGRQVVWEVPLEHADKEALRADTVRGLDAAGRAVSVTTRARVADLVGGVAGRKLRGLPLMSVSQS